MKRNSKLLFILSIFIICIFSLLDFNQKDAYAKSNTSIYFKCNKPDIVAGDTFKIIVAVKNVSNLYGASVDFNYDMSKVEFLNVNNVDGFSNALSTQLVKNDSSNGLLSFYTTFTGNKLGITDFGSDLFEITFRAKKDCSFYFNSSNILKDNSIVIKLSDNNAKPIPFTSSNFYTNITKRSTIINLASNTTDNTAVVDNEITFTSQANSLHPLSYKFWMKKDGENWKELSNYSDSNKITWKPTQPGNYTISSYVKSKDSPFDPDDCKVIDMKILDNKILTDVRVNNNTPNPNEEITVQASSNSSDILYKFWINDGSGWQVVKDYSSDKKISIKLPKIGSYKFSVYAKSKYSLSECDDMKLIDVDVLPTVSLNSSSNTAYINGEKIKLTANTNIQGQYEYQFWALENNQWKVIQDYSANNSTYFTPKNAKNIKFSVYVRNKDGKNIVMDMTNVNILETSLNIEKSNLNIISKPGDIANIKVNSNNPNALYKFWVLENNQWKVIKDYSSDNSMSYKIPSIGDYRFSVYVKDKNSLLECDNMKLLDLIVSPTIKLNTSNNTTYLNGEKVKLIANTDITGDYEYKFWVLENNNWNVIQDYSSNNTAYFTPKQLGNMKVSVYVKNKNNKDIVMDMNSINVLETSLSIEHSNLNTISKPGDIVNLKVNSNNPNAVFKFWVLENNQWKVIKDYSKDKSMSFKVPSNGDYRFSIYVKDKNSSSECDNMKLLDLSVK